MIWSSGKSSTMLKAEINRKKKIGCEKDVRKNFFSMRVVNWRNSLPLSIVTAPTVNAFKNRLDRDLRLTSPSLPKPTISHPVVGVQMNSPQKTKMHYRISTSVTTYSTPLFSTLHYSNMETVPGWYINRWNYFSTHYSVTLFFSKLSLIPQEINSFINLHRLFSNWVWAILTLCSIHTCTTIIIT